MKRLALFMAAAVLVLSLAACGNRDNNGNNTNTGRPNNGVTDNVPGNDTGVPNTPGSGVNNGVNNGLNNGTNGGTTNRPNGGVGNNNVTGNNDVGNNGTGNGVTGNNGTVNGNDTIVDRAENAVDDLMGNNSRNSSGRVNPTSFQQMLEDARVG